MKLGALGKQVGPLPLGVWLLVGAGGLFIAYRSSKADAPEAAPAGGTGVVLPQGGGYDAPTSWDGAPVVLSPVIQVESPRVPVNNDMPTLDPEPLYAPAPISLPVAPPRVDAGYAARHAAYLASPAGKARAAVNAKQAAATSYARRHAAYLVSPAGKARAAANKANHR